LTMFTVDINGEKQIEVAQGQSLYEGLAAAEVFIPSACGGRAICGYCKVKVTKGGGEVMPSELPFLNSQELSDNVRLSCQVKVSGDIAIEIPKGLLSGRQYKCVCSDIEELTSDIRRFRFDLARPKSMSYVPGQFVQMLTPVYFQGGEEVYRPYSIAGDPADKNAFETIIRRAPNGISTTYLFENLSVGDKVTVNGPCGDFHLSDTDSPIIFIAGGSGMAPIRCILNHMRNTASKRKAVYYFGANRVSELFMLDEMKQFENDLYDFRFVPVVASPDSDEHWAGLTGLVTEAVESDLENAGLCEAYLCGSPGMIEASGKVLARLGVPEEKTFYDSFA
jgi:Na+-transporting NADH:ubiquinone oxidoreductase subunit F